LKTAVAFTEKNPAARETKGINSAFAFNLVTASAGCHFFEVFASDFFSEIYHFGRGNEQPMVESVEIAAFPAGLTFAGFILMCRNLLIEPFINGFHPPDYFLIAFHFSTTAGCF